ncbi:MAG TPA: hypothetical protein VK559_02020 [Ferruginibacter sp.]|nr:hypothetical protein [Ferruginibacter sp.]
MKISTLAFALLLCSIFFSCKKEGVTQQSNGITAIINGVIYSFNYHDTLYEYATPPTQVVVGYSGMDTLSSTQNRIIIALAEPDNYYSGSVSVRLSDSTNTYSTLAGTYFPVNGVTLVGKVAVGTFQGNVYLNGDSTQTKLVVTSGNFSAAAH